MSVWLPAFLTEPGSTRYSSPPSITTVWSNCQTSYNDFFEVYISNMVTLSPKCSNGAFTSLTFSMSITWPIILRPHWSNHLQLIYTITVGHKYVNVHRHKLLILSEINNGESMTVTVPQRKASTQQIGLLLVPAITGAVYINTHSI